MGLEPLYDVFVARHAHPCALARGQTRREAGTTVETAPRGGVDMRRLLLGLLLVLVAGRRVPLRYRT